MIRARQRARVDVPFDSEAHFRIWHWRDRMYIRMHARTSTRTPARIPANKLNLQIPFLLLPGILPPPIPRNPPRPGRRHHSPIQSAKKYFHRTPFAQFHSRRQTREDNGPACRWAPLLR